MKDLTPEMTDPRDDHNGNITSDGTYTFIYDQKNRLSQVKQNTTVIADYIYDAYGRRVKKTTASGDTVYHYDENSRLIAETLGYGTPIIDYIYLEDECVAIKLYGAQAGLYYVVNDHLATPQMVLNSVGLIVWQAAYSPFGQVDLLMNTIPFNMRFPGQYHDQETGLLYNWHRYYDPAIGRYLTPDPIGHEGGDLNLYAYVTNNPIYYIDPLGLIQWSAVGKGSLRVLGGVAGVVSGAFLSSTGPGAVYGVPAVLAGSASFGWGISQIIVGFTDNEIPFNGTVEAQEWGQVFHRDKFVTMKDLIII